MEKQKKKLSLTTQILAALVLGVVAGILLQGNQNIATGFIKPFGTIFLNLIKTIVVPVVIFSITQGIISLKDIKKVGTIGGKTLIYYICTTAFAVTFGLVVANALHVGNGYILNTASLQAYNGDVKMPSLMDTFVNIFPSNAVAPLASATMLQVIVIALLFGFGIIAAGEKGKPAAAFVESMSEVCIKIMGMILRLSPIGVFALITPVVAQNGVSVLLPLIKLIMVAYVASILHVLIVYSSTVKIIAKMSPIKFFKGMSTAMLFAFSSASSVGTLPFNLECTEKLGADKEIASFVLPLGATINMDGTAIYQGVCAIFIAQIFGMDLNISQQIMIILTATLASIGTAGVPGSGVIMLAMVLQSVGLPLEGIALVAGIDRILDMARTTVNITGDAACTMCIDATEKRKKARLKNTQTQ
ncbi:MAG: dicarboxylate/amino acid:cation symporter [Clostridia bacterium]|jgi:Na+/H+-dicarboxylate symporter|nr:dicarboxylate/amino acid:cation symporter [Clostridia bacterium]MCI1999355.1 dicarboxylate/amino acid:cation symporter [Clostridia bacterium]MCI2015143.1 dicarboxylate/amino acid:cation symporter [Clostridia bacterium]